MSIKIYADGANAKDMLSLYQTHENVKGFTTNPTLMKAAGVKEYVPFVKSLLREITDLPISFEVFADDEDGMYDQAMRLSSFGSNVYVKIPVMNTKAEPTYNLIYRLANNGVLLNVTAVFTNEQVQSVSSALSSDVPSIISIFAGRISDTGVDPTGIIANAKDLKRENTEILWASPRSVYNYYEADRAGCDIITMTPDLIKKLSLQNKDLTEYSLDTVKMFFNDAKSAGYTL